MQKKSEVPTFVDAARTIAKVDGDPPERLVQGLAHFCDHYIGVSRAKAGKPSREGELERVMLKAATALKGDENRIAGGLRLCTEYNAHRKMNRWYVEGLG
jgi:hypothetical protein